jgi:hypothetical protein
VAGGFEILKLESTIESTTLPFEQARARLRTGLRASARRRDARLHQAAHAGVIEWKNDEIRKHEAGWPPGANREAKQG